MAFSKKPNHTIKVSSDEINRLSDELSILSDITINIDLIRTGELLGISRETLSKMMLSLDPVQKSNVELIKNLKISLENYTLDELPPQLINYIDQLKLEINQSSTGTLEELPSYFNLLLSNTTSNINISDINYELTEDENESIDDNESIYDNESINDNESIDDNESYDEIYNFDEPVKLSSLIITPELIKNDIFG